MDQQEPVKPGETDINPKVITLIFPPKRTVVETVLQILRVRPEACILLCAPSNPATDTLVSRLRDNLKPNEMLRLNDQNRTFAEVPNIIIQYCCTSAYIELKICN
jgi:hypothetical protein